jgi:cytidine deaminase
MNDQELIKIAKNIIKNSYSPYSKFRVAAVLVSDKDEIFTGVNVENASYGLSNCAERTAIFKAVSEGVRKFKKILVYAPTKCLTSPCGACRQVLLEFSPKMKVLISNGKKTIRESALDLMPYSFLKSNLTKK